MHEGVVDIVKRPCGLERVGVIAGHGQACFVAQRQRTITGDSAERKRIAPGERVKDVKIAHRRAVTTVRDLWIVERDFRALVGEDVVRERKIIERIIASERKEGMAAIRTKLKHTRVILIRRIADDLQVLCLAKIDCVV